MKLKSVLFIALILFISTTAAQSNQTAQKQYDSGWIDSGSPLYGMELAIDNAAISIGVKKASKVAQERVAEVEKASKRNNTKGMERATKAFENSAKKAKADETEEISAAEAALEKAIQNAPEQAQQGLSTALENVRKDRREKAQAGQGNRPESSQNRQPDRDVRDSIQNKSPNTDSQTGDTNTSPRGTQNTTDRSQQTRDRDRQTSSTDDSSTQRSSATGRFDLMISDRPADISKFDFVNVEFSKARIFMKNKKEDTEINDNQTTNETINETTETIGNETVNETENTTQESGNEGFRVIQLNNSSVDLTTVVGNKAQSIADIELDEGTYTKIELYSSNIDAEINDSSVDVKIPPKKLMLTKPFEVSANETTQFVFDIQVVLRGNERNNQGYILKPVISESGVAGKDVEIEENSDSTEEERRISDRDKGNETKKDRGGQPEEVGSGNPKTNPGQNP